MAEEKLNANDTLSKVLAYVDSPFKLFAVILMAVLAFSGWMFYDNKELLVGAYKEQQKLPQIAEGRTNNPNNNRDVVALMANEIPCGEYKTAQSEVGLWYIEKGMTYGCRISVPPEQDRFIGQLTVGWATPPANLEHTRAMLMIAATMLAKERK